MKTRLPPWPVWVAGAATLAVWWALWLAPDAFVTTVFCRVPAWVAARYYNATLQIPELVFFARGITIEVIRPCGATDFFAMVAGLFTYHAINNNVAQASRPVSLNKAQAGRPVLRCLFILPLAWCVTLMANSIRIIFLVPTKAWLYHHPWFLERAHLDDHFGTFIFLTLFLLLWEGVRHARRNTATTR